MALHVSLEEDFTLIEGAESLILSALCSLDLAAVDIVPWPVLRECEAQLFLFHLI